MIVIAGLTNLSHRRSLGIITIQDRSDSLGVGALESVNIWCFWQTADFYGEVRE